MTKNQAWRNLQLYSLGSILDRIETAERVRIYPSRKHEGLTMIKVQVSGTEFTGSLATSDLPKLAEAFRPFTAAPDKHATVYTRPTTVQVRLYLEYAVTALESFGWHPARGRQKPTWREALELYTDRQPITPGAIQRADEILAVLRYPEDSDYARRLADLLGRQETYLSNLPVLASAPVALDRRRAREAARLVSRHMGTPGEPYQAGFLEVTYTRLVETSAGELVRLYKLRDEDNNQFTCWRDVVQEFRHLPDTTAEVIEVTERESAGSLPQRFAGQVMVISHTAYQGTRETVISVDLHQVYSLEICPACGGRYDQNECSCISDLVEFDFQPGEFDIELESMPGCSPCDGRQPDDQTYPQGGSCESI